MFSTQYNSCTKPALSIAWYNELSLHFEQQQKFLHQCLTNLAILSFFLFNSCDMHFVAQKFQLSATKNLCMSISFNGFHWSLSIDFFERKKKVYHLKLELQSNYVQGQIEFWDPKCHKYNSKDERKLLGLFDKQVFCQVCLLQIF